MKNLKSLLLPAALALLAVCSASAQTIVGAWRFGDTTTDDSGVLVFFGNGTYFHIEDTTPGAGPSGFDGFERGTYSWSGTNGTSFTATPINDTNGDIGISSIFSGTTLSISGNSFVFTDADGLGSGPGETLIRVTGANALVGAWYVGDVTGSQATNNSGVAVFLNNGRFFLARDLPNGDPDGADEIEHGTYLWNPGTGTFSFPNSALVDQNANVGLYSPPLITSFSVSGSTLTGFDGGNFYLTSVNSTAIPEPSTYAALAGLGALGLAFWRRRQRVTAA